MDQVPTVQKSLNLYSIQSMRFSANSPEKNYIFWLPLDQKNSLSIPSLTFHSILSATYEYVMCHSCYFWILYMEIPQTGHQLK